MGSSSSHRSTEDKEAPPFRFRGADEQEGEMGVRGEMRGELCVAPRLFFFCLSKQQQQQQADRTRYSHMRVMLIPKRMRRTTAKMGPPLLNECVLA